MTNRLKKKFESFGFKIKGRLITDRLKKKFKSFGFNGEIKATRFGLTIVSLTVVSALLILKDNDYLASVVVKMVKLIFGLGS